MALKLQKRVLKFSNPTMFGTSRAHKNLNKLARACVELGAINSEKAVPFTLIAVNAGVDRSNALKLLADRPGFTRVIREEAGRRSLGYYYHAVDFLPVAHGQGDYYYPTNTATLAKRDYPLEEVLYDGVPTEIFRVPDPTYNVAQAQVTTQSPSKRRESLTIEVIDFRGREVELLKITDSILSQLSAEVNRLTTGEWSGPIDLSILDNSMVALASLYRVIEENKSNPEYTQIIQEARNGVYDLPAGD